MENGSRVLLSSEARTATNSVDFENRYGSGIHVILDVTAVAATPSVVVTINALDNASGKYYTLLTSAAVTGTGTYVYKVFPAATAVANQVVNDIAPRNIRITLTHADADSITYSLGINTVV
jgi:hypothetical protein